MSPSRSLPVFCCAIAVAVFPALGDETRPGASPPAAAAVERPALPRQLVAEVVASYPHDRGAFTQGLLYFD